MDYDIHQRTLTNIPHIAFSPKLVQIQDTKNNINKILKLKKTRKKIDMSLKKYESISIVKNDTLPSLSYQNNNQLSNNISNMKLHLNTCSNNIVNDKIDKKVKNKDLNEYNKIFREGKNIFIRKSHNFDNRPNILSDSEAYINTMKNYEKNNNKIRRVNPSFLSEHDLFDNVNYKFKVMQSKLRFLKCFFIWIFFQCYDKTSVNTKDK